MQLVVDRELDLLRLHLKDVHVSRLPHQHGFVVEGRPAGEGDLDIPQLLARLRALKRDLNVILELWPPAAATTAAAIATEADWAARSLRHLRALVAD